MNQITKKINRIIVHIVTSFNNLVTENIFFPTGLQITTSNEVHLGIQQSRINGDLPDMWNNDLDDRKLGDQIEDADYSRQYKDRYLRDDDEDMNDSLLNKERNTFFSENEQPFSFEPYPENIPNLEEIPSIPINAYTNKPSENTIPYGFSIQPDLKNEVVKIVIPSKYKKVIIVQDQKENSISLVRLRNRVPFTPLEKKCILDLYQKYRCIHDISKRAIAEMIYRDIYCDDYSSDPTVNTIRKNLKDSKELKSRTVTSVLNLIYNVRRKFPLKNNEK